jgi:hypothetical protein
MPTRFRSSAGSTVRAVDVDSVKQYLSLDPGSFDKVIHPVQCPQKG